MPRLIYEIVLQTFRQVLNAKVFLNYGNPSEKFNSAWREKKEWIDMKLWRQNFFYWEHGSRVKLEEKKLSSDFNEDFRQSLTHSLLSKAEPSDHGSTGHSWAKLKIVLVRKPGRKVYYFMAKSQSSGFSFPSLNQNIKVVVFPSNFWFKNPR